MIQLAERMSKQNELTVHTIKTDKYKTNSFILMMRAPLTKDTVAMRALLPHVLQNGTVKSPSRMKLRERLDDMYGALLSTDVQKKGEEHVITVRLDVANERFLSKSENLFEKSVMLLAEVILEPNAPDGAFPSSVMNNEKRSLAQRIDSISDDKMRYANVRITEEMCKGEPYALTSFGTSKDVQAITEKSLYDYYKEMLKTNAFDLYVVGDFEEDFAIETIKKAFHDIATQSNPSTMKKQQNKVVEEEKVVHEEQDLKQGKLHIGFRTHTTFASDDYVAMQVCNGLFGGFPHSKLFMNVREKESLAYYAASQLESHKGIMMVMSGIEFNKYDRAVEIIKEQFQAMKDGDFSSDELEQTKAMLKNQILETSDVVRGLVELSYHQVVSNHSRPIDEWLQQIDKVTKEDVVRVANKIKLDTIYFLKGKEGEAK